MATFMWMTMMQVVTTMMGVMWYRRKHPKEAREMGMAMKRFFMGG